MLMDSTSVSLVRPVGGRSAQENHARIKQIAEQLDQCWDLLRQRRAREEYGQNPDDARVRDVRTVEGYGG